VPGLNLIWTTSVGVGSGCASALRAPSATVLTTSHRDTDRIAGRPGPPSSGHKIERYVVRVKAMLVPAPGCRGAATNAPCLRGARHGKRGAVRRHRPPGKSAHA
jgi:hypothetical protein